MSRGDEIGLADGTTVVGHVAEIGRTWRIARA